MPDMQGLLREAVEAAPRAAERSVRMLANAIEMLAPASRFRMFTDREVEVLAALLDGAALDGEGERRIEQRLAAEADREAQARPDLVARQMRDEGIPHGTARDSADAQFGD